MRKMFMGLLAVSLTVGNLLAAETIENKTKKLVKSVQEACKTEMGTFCKDVNPGEGRLLACLYAFEDKVSGSCEYALYDAVSQLEKAVVKLQHVENQCSADIDKYCSAIAPGEGRILDCLNKNDKKIAAKCSQALKDTNLK